MLQTDTASNKALSVLDQPIDIKPQLSPAKLSASVKSTDDKQTNGSPGRQDLIGSPKATEANLKPALSGSQSSPKPRSHRTGAFNGIAASSIVVSSVNVKSSPQDRSALESGSDTYSMQDALGKLNIKLGAFTFAFDKDKDTVSATSRELTTVEKVQNVESPRTDLQTVEHPKKEPQIVEKQQKQSSTADGPFLNVQTDEDLKKKLHNVKNPNKELEKIEDRNTSLKKVEKPINTETPQNESQPVESQLRKAETQLQKPQKQLKELQKPQKQQKELQRNGNQESIVRTKNPQKDGYSQQNGASHGQVVQVPLLLNEVLKVTRYPPRFGTYNSSRTPRLEMSKETTRPLINTEEGLLFYIFLSNLFRDDLKKMEAFLYTVCRESHFIKVLSAINPPFDTCRMSIANPSGISNHDIEKTLRNHFGKLLTSLKHFAEDSMTELTEISNSIISLNSTLSKESGDTKYLELAKEFVGRLRSNIDLFNELLCLMSIQEARCVDGSYLYFPKMFDIGVIGMQLRQLGFPIPPRIAPRLYREKLYEILDGKVFQHWSHSFGIHKIDPPEFATIVGTLTNLTGKADLSHFQRQFLTEKDTIVACEPRKSVDVQFEKHLVVIELGQYQQPPPRLTAGFLRHKIKSPINFDRTMNSIHKTCPEAFSLELADYHKIQTEMKDYYENNATSNGYFEDPSGMTFELLYEFKCCRICFTDMHSTSECPKREKAV